MDASLERTLITKRIRVKALEAMLVSVLLTCLLVVASVWARQWAVRQGIVLDPGVELWLALLPPFLLLAVSLVVIAIAYSPALPFSWAARLPGVRLPTQQAYEEPKAGLERPPRHSATRGR